MSCQQVPRLTEDPYVFTETTPSVTVYNPQIHKLTPIIQSTLSPSASAQKQFITQKSQTTTNNKINQSQTQQLLQQQQQQQQLFARINGGIPQIVNGLQRNIGSSAGGFQKQFQLQCQQQQQQQTKLPGKLQRKYSSPSVNLSVDEAFHQSFTAHSISKPSNVASSTPISTNAPTIYQKSTFIPQSNTLPQTEMNNCSQRDHSNLNKSIQLNTTSRTSQQYLSMNPNVNYQPTIITSVNSTPSTISKKISSSKFGNIQNELKTPNVDSHKQKSVNGDKGIFLAPNKRESKVLSLSARKASKNQPSQSSKVKRSYGQSSHHEALQRISSVSSTASSVNEWHAPDSYIFDNVLPFSSYLNSEKCDDYDTAPCVQFHWLNVSDIIKSIPTSTSITREQRIELRKAQLRRQAVQNIIAQQFRNTLNAKRRFICVSKALQKLKDRDESPPPKKCCFPTCSNNALAMTAYCYLHIARNTEQFLFLPCTAKFSDNSQCRVPVFDITHELPLCREHAWKRDNYNRIIQEQKPKKSSRKRPKSMSSSRPQKRKQKRRKTSSSAIVNNVTIQESTDFDNLINYDHHHHLQIKPDPEINYTTPSQITTSLNQVPLVAQDVLTVCENSSAYESSEDTGVGGLSESELMVGAHDVIEEIPLGDTRLLEEHDLTNVLNQLPVDAFNELFTTVQQNGPLEPTQEEQEDLERALEAVNKQVKSLQQMTAGDSAFLGDFLDVDDQILDDTEVVLNSSDTVIDTSMIVDGSNSNSESVGATEGVGGSCHSSTASNIRELVQT